MTKFDKITANVHLIVLATDPASKAGGIATSLPGFLELVRQTGVSYAFVATHAAHKPGGKWRPFIQATPALYQEIRAARRRGQRPVAWMQVGGPVSSLRKAILAAGLNLVGVPVITQLHGVSVAGYLEKSLYKWLFFLSLAPSTVIVVLTPWWERLLRQEGLRKSLAVVPNVLSEDLERITLEKDSKRQGLESSGLRVLAMSRIVSGKGFEQVIDALTYCDSSVTLFIAGDGRLRKELEERVVRLGLQGRVTFLGWVGDSEKDSALRNCDVFCLPSSFDSFGMGFIEAMAYGKPVIALAEGPTLDVVPNEKCGILVPPEDTSAVASALERLRKHSAQRHMFGQAGRDWVRMSYSRQAVKPQIISAIYEALHEAKAE